MTRMENKLAEELTDSRDRYKCDKINDERQFFSPFVRASLSRSAHRDSVTRDEAKFRLRADVTSRKFRPVNAFLNMTSCSDGAPTKSGEDTRPRSWRAAGTYRGLIVDYFSPFYSAGITGVTLHCNFCAPLYLWPDRLHDLSARRRNGERKRKREKEGERKKEEKGEREKTREPRCLCSTPAIKMLLAPPHAA